MSGLYCIPISGMNEDSRCFDFEIGNDFFAQFEGAEISEGKLKVLVKANKGPAHIDLTILIDGAVNISCDRCLGIFPFPLNCTNSLLVKFGKQHDESDPDIIIVSEEENELNLVQYFYEYIILALPIQRIHPTDENGNNTCDPEMISRLNRHLKNNNTGTDPRWDELRKITNN
ncbi:MAG: DUF177 domain-containing protein [Bacteroidales bacterium]|nr:DUF177 domain-containing protein [Bacteroidales bacterium]